MTRLEIVFFIHVSLHFSILVTLTFKDRVIEIHVKLLFDVDFAGNRK